MDLTGKAAIVTGGASGIGEALVVQLRDAGADVLAVDLDQPGLDRVSEATGCTTMHIDVTSRAANLAVVARCIELFGTLDLSFLNAGVLDRKREELGDPFGVNDLDFDRYELVRGVLLDAVVHGTAAATERMQGDGTIIATASAAGLVPWHPTPIYSAMKHGVVGWVRAVAPALERDGVRINAICPGGIATPLLGVPAERSESIDRMLSPREVAAAMIELALGDRTGEAWSIVANRDPVLQPHDFNAIPDFP
ncbi:MAG: SDR family NAD(P)-dependent oxidoreductase [Actinomycetota bacterium]